MIKSEAIEFTRFGQWKFDTSTAPTTAPDLSDSRAAIDGFNKTMVDEIALQWNSLHSPTCADELNEATEFIARAHMFCRVASGNGRRRSRPLDPLYRQALSSATDSYCQLT